MAGASIVAPARSFRKKKKEMNKKQKQQRIDDSKSHKIKEKKTVGREAESGVGASVERENKEPPTVLIIRAPMAFRVR
jgi:hypothetical protein